MCDLKLPKNFPHPTKESLDQDFLEIVERVTESSDNILDKYFQVICYVSKYRMFLGSLRPEKNFTNKRFFESPESSSIDALIVEKIQHTSFIHDKLLDREKLDIYIKYEDKSSVKSLMISELLSSLNAIQRIDESLKEILSFYNKPNIRSMLTKRESFSNLYN